MVVLRFNVGGKFRYNPFRYENPTVVEWKCEVQNLSYELLIWILGRMKVNNVGRILFYNEWDEDERNFELDLIMLMCEITLGILVQIAKDNDVVDIYVEHDESLPLFIDGKPQIQPCDLLRSPESIHPTYFNNDIVQLVGGSNFIEEEGVTSQLFPRHINEDHAPFSPETGEQNLEGQNGGDRVVHQESGENSDDSEYDESDPEDFGVEGGLGTWVDVPQLSEDEEYRILKRRKSLLRKKRKKDEKLGPESVAVAATRTSEDNETRSEVAESRDAGVSVSDEIGDESDVSAVSSSEGSEADHGRRRRKTSKLYKASTNYREIPVLENGMIFKTGKEFKDAVIEHSLKVHREVSFVKNDKLRIRVKCLEPTCKWYVYARHLRHKFHWQIRTLLSQHTCPRVFTNSRINYKIIAEHFITERKSSAASMKQKDIKKFTKEELGIEISESQARRARIQISKHFCGDFEKEFTRLWDFVEELKVSNPGSTAVLDAPGNIFKRLYVCFDAVKRGFMEGCRRVLGVDGCFLKGPYKQQLLSVVGRDANEQMFPVAWAVVDIENHSNWIWFLDLVMKDLHIREGGLGWSFQSDQHPSIIHAFRELMPQAETRRCARHIFSKWRKGRDGDLYADLYWSTVKSTNLPQLEDNLKRMYNYDPDAVDAILKVPPKFWCKNFFQCLSKSDVVDNNMCETFNAFIIEARYMSIVTMLEKIRMLVVSRFVQMRGFGNSAFVGGYGPRIWARIEDNKDKSVYCHVFTNGDGGWEVFEGQIKYIVGFGEKKCSCRAWDLTGIPCQHAVAVISHMRAKVEDFMCDWYTKDMFLKAYAYSIKPINDERFRSKTSLPDILPPPRKAVLGRRRVNRIPERWESKHGKKVERKVVKQRCTICFRQGHKSTTCKKKNGGDSQERTINHATQNSTNNHATQNSTTNTQVVPRRRNQFDNTIQLRPFNGIESFINPITGMTMPNRQPGMVETQNVGSRWATNTPRNHVPEPSRPTRWFGDYLQRSEQSTSSVPATISACEQQSIPATVTGNEQHTTPEIQVTNPELYEQTTPSIPATIPAYEQQETPTFQSIVHPEKRRRGRPKGSKNKKHRGLP